MARVKSPEKRTAILRAAVHEIAKVGRRSPGGRCCEVPVRLILGVGVEKRVQQAEAAGASEAEKWRHLTVSSVFEDGRFDSRLYMANSGIDS
jgi:hypothetical protein